MRQALQVLSVLIILASIGVSGVAAHANLIRTEPSTNVAPQVPAEIRLFFTEPLEPGFSRITIRDAEGAPLDALTSQVDPADTLQMFIAPGDLPDGLYTISWSALSTVDGHQTRGSFPLTIGAAAAGSAANIVSGVDEEIPAASAVIRWVNLLSLALGVGSVGFWVFVWRPSIPEGHPAIERRMLRLTWAGWVAVGISGVLLLLLQVATIAQVSVLAAISDPSLDSVISDTRFGDLWLQRMVLWLIMGVALFLARRDQQFYWTALVPGIWILLTNSLNSHANAAPDTFVAVLSDWLHLLAMSVWVGGLLLFASIINPTRRAFADNTQPLGRLVGYFSNFARVAVVILILTGIYATWLQIGSIEGLYISRYGQALLLKLVLIAPVLFIAAVNATLTHRGIQAGQPIWGARLRKLVGIEFSLTVVILAAVGVMTAIVPARDVVAFENAIEAAPPVPVSNLYYEGFYSPPDNIHVDLQFEPGWAGENEFTVVLYTHEGDPIEDASLIRLRFENQEQNLGESELRPVHQGDGIYTVSGANLSVPGEWRVRTTVQRPEQFDTVADFLPVVESRPQASAAPVISATDTFPTTRIPALIIVGVAALITSILLTTRFVSAVSATISRRWMPLPTSPESSNIENHPLRARLQSGAGLLTSSLALLGIVFLVSAARVADTPAVSTVAAAGNTATLGSPPQQLVFSRDLDLPYLITEDGGLLQPGEDGVWRSMSVDGKVADAYFDSRNRLWVTTDNGLRLLEDDGWQQVDDIPATRLVSTHGYLFSLGTGEINRVSSMDQARLLDVPLGDQSTSEFVMLGNHSHVLQNGADVFQSIDLGLSWQPLEAPGTVDAIWTGQDGHLLAATDEGLARWDFIQRAWSIDLPLPDGNPIEQIYDFNNGLYAIAENQLYQRSAGGWQAVALPDAPDASITALMGHFPGGLWALDSGGNRLWTTIDNETWESIPIRFDTG